ncbi:TetR family transcriptional regulator [Paraburkholderia strydomiana]|uniref:TetR family transcriptional regulator n=1 Tax=Paraburkholderia strydomiana TaxID=1245417 RepID=A0ABW9BYJ5_9BURK
MKHERLTHARRKQQTRERLFEAARSVFLEKGLAATSVEDIVKARVIRAAPSTPISTAKRSYF